MFLSLSRSFRPPASVRSLTQRAASLHTLPQLPYPHNVNLPHLILALADNFVQTVRRWSHTSLQKSCSFIT
jgi:hypothetical protein